MPLTIFKGGKKYRIDVTHRINPRHKSRQTGVISVFSPGRGGGGLWVSMKTNKDKAEGILAL
jgi:hypothetical protein